MDTDTAPFALNKAKAPLVRNLLTDRPGVLSMRGPLSTALTLSLPGSCSGIVGAAPVASQTSGSNVVVYMGLRAISATATREPWVAPYRLASAAAQLAVANGNLSVLNLGTNTASQTQPAIANADSVPRRSTRLGANTYYLSYDATQAPVTQNGGFFKLCRIAWVSATSGAVLTSGPDGVMDVRAHLQRLFALGGRNVPGGAPTTINMNTLYWTDPLQDPTTGGVTAWKDSVTGLVNQIIVDTDDQNDFGVALAKIGANLCVFKRRSIHVLRGYSTATFAIRPFTQEQGCLDPRSVVEHDDGCFFVSQQGFMWFDGSRLVNYTPDLKTSFLKSVLKRVGDTGIDGGFVQCIKLPNNYIMLTVGLQSFVDGSTTIDFCGLFNLTTKSWSTFSCTLMAGTAPNFVWPVPTWPLISDGVSVYRANQITLPETAVDASRGFDLNGAGAAARIPSRFTSRLAALGSPIHADQIHRITFDYAFRVAGSTDNSFGGWFFSVIGGDGRVLVPQTQVQAMGDPGSYLFRRQATFDPFTETVDAQVIVEWKDDGSSTFPPVKQGDIHQTIFEFYPSSQQRSQ